jgi:predicted acetyltransferase
VVTVRPYLDSDIDRVYRIRRTAFAGPRISPQWTVDPGGWYGFVGEVDGRTAGFLRIHEYQQFFGDKPVPMGGVSSVAVTPSARGRGVAGLLLRTAIEQMRERGQVISALFAAVPPLYRGHGWEHCGAQDFVAVTPEFLAAVGKPESPVTLRPAVEADMSGLRDCYRRVASTVDGMLAHDGPRFPHKAPLDADICDVAGDPVRGYLTARRDVEERLDVRELVAADTDTARALLRSLWSWAGQTSEISLPVVDPAVHDLVAGWPGTHRVRAHPWMLRVIDLAGAVAARGWRGARHLKPAALDLEITDEHAPWHSGRHRLIIDDGVRLERGGNGAVRFTARGLAAWYGGASGLGALRRFGLVDGERTHDALLDLLTAAPAAPRMSDDF